MTRTEPFQPATRYEQSLMIDFDYERMRKAVPVMLEALE
jgi:hypothetical protein